MNDRSDAVRAPQRADIQSLRGYAVLLVVLYHAKLIAIPAGYLGVDVFFVISGFLIGRLVLADVDAGTFSFAEFYARRAKRLLPAAYVTFAAVALVAPLLLGTLELRALRDQLLGAITFSSNIVLQRQSGYFDGASELKPLLHAWSLSVEEQFYLLLPAALVFLPRRWRLVAVGAATLGSLWIAERGAGSSAAFYLLPSRAWELLLGVLGASVSTHRWGVWSSRMQWMPWFAIPALLLLPFFPLRYTHPGPAALLVCTATLVLLLVESRLIGAITPLRWLGDRSYSLYLVHWPLFAFFNNAWMGRQWTDETFYARVALAAASVILAAVLYATLERPIHRARMPAPRRMVITAVAATLMLAALSVWRTMPNTFDRDFAHERRRNYGIAESCATLAAFSPRAECRTSAAPNTMLWGDSFAMHLVPGLLATADSGFSLVQATRPECAPLLGVAVLAGPGGAREQAEGCLQFNDSVLAYLRDTPTITTVVLSSPFAPYVRADRTLLARTENGNTSERNASVSEALAALERTATSVRALGRRVVVVGPTPSSGVDVARCAERSAMGLLTFGAEPQCAIPATRARGLWPEVVDFLDRAESDLHVPIVRLTDAMCDATTCHTMQEGRSLYRDESHLSYHGSEVIARRMQLVARIRRD